MTGGQVVAELVERAALFITFGEVPFLKRGAPYVLQLGEPVVRGGHHVRCDCSGDVCFAKLDLMKERAEYGFELERLGNVVPIQAEPRSCPSDPFLHAGAE